MNSHTDLRIDEAVSQVSVLFDEIRESKKIPLADLRNHVLPLLQEAIQDSNFFALVESLQTKDDYTYRHCVAVGTIAGLLGNWLGLHQQELLQLITAGLLHDTGMMLVPEVILNKHGPLTDEEFVIMKTHTVLGYDLLKQTTSISHRQALAALQHHERMDGSGYPFGLTHNKIDLFSRIVAAADIFHAMTSKRVYRNPSPFYEVLVQMDNAAFGALDPRIMKVFIHKIMISLIGHSVLLTNGIRGTIVLFNEHAPMHPLVQADAGFIDLSKDRTVFIQQIL